MTPWTRAGGAALELRHPAGTVDGAEVRTTALFRTGTYRARIRAAAAPSSVTGFFLYAPPDYASEVDLDRKAVTFRVDGVALRSWKNGVPIAPMALYLNSWFPAWLAGTPSPGAATLVDRVDVTS
jgi:hypothetical protein